MAEKTSLGQPPGEEARDAAPPRPSARSSCRLGRTGSDSGRGSERACSVARTINILADAWAFLILREAFFGARHFEVFRSRLGIPRATLADRLAGLVSKRVLRKRLSGSDGRQFDYQLTRMGFELYPTFIAMMQFGDRWLSDGKPPLSLVHDGCGCETHPRIACSECLEEVRPGDVTFRDGPGAGLEPSPAGRSTRRSSDDAKFLIGRPSSVSRTLQIIGDRWSFMVVREAFFGVRRYDQMQSGLGIAPNILTDRLARFVTNGIFERRLYRAGPNRYEYVLTSKGRDLYGPFLAMLAWGDRWLAPAGPPLTLTHRGCGRDFTPTLVCDVCRETIHAAAMHYRPQYDATRYGGPARRPD